jgi:hypothetical protein
MRSGIGEALSVPAIAMEGEPRRVMALTEATAFRSMHGMDQATHWIKSKTLTGTVPVCLCRW